MMGRIGVRHMFWGERNSLGLDLEPVCSGYLSEIENSDGVCG